MAVLGGAAVVAAIPTAGAVGAVLLVALPVAMVWVLVVETKRAVGERQLISLHLQAMLIVLVCSEAWAIAIGRAAAMVGEIARMLVTIAVLLPPVTSPSAVIVVLTVLEVEETITDHHVIAGNADKTMMGKRMLASLVRRAAIFLFSICLTIGQTMTSMNILHRTEV